MFSNVLVRVLLMRLPQSQLQAFMYDLRGARTNMSQWSLLHNIWQHNCTLGTETLAVLFKTQASSLTKLRYFHAGPLRSDVCFSENRNLTKISLEGLDPIVGSDWPCR